MALQKKINDIIYDGLMDQIELNYDELKTKLQEDTDKWVFCLGAGVSVSCGLPDWKKLLYVMMGKIIRHIPKASLDEDKNMDISKCMNIAYNRIKDNSDIEKIFREKVDRSAENGTYISCPSIDSLELAEYIKNDIKESVDCRINKKGKADEKIIDRNIINYVKSAFNIDCARIERDDKGKDTTLKAIADVMTDKKIHRAITYNYDNLLEIALRTKGKNVKSYIPENRQEFVEDNIINEEDSSDNSPYKIYHCHGRIAVKINDKDKRDLAIYNDDDDGDRIILTESSYYQEEVNGYSLSNVLQSYAIDYCNTIFIGFSGSDYTFRRIVKGINLESNEKSYIFFAIDDIVEDVVAKSAENKAGNTSEYKKVKNEIIEAVASDIPGEYEFEKFMINNIVQSKTRYWKEKGFQVIWSTIDELPDMIKNL